MACRNPLNNRRYGLDFRNPSHPPHTHTGALLAAASTEPTSRPPSSWAGPACPPRPHPLQSGEGAPFLGVHLPPLSISICSGCLSFCSRSALHNMGPCGEGNEGERGLRVHRRASHNAKDNRSAHSSCELSACPSSAWNCFLKSSLCLARAWPQRKEGQTLGRRRGRGGSPLWASVATSVEWGEKYHLLPRITVRRNSRGPFTCAHRSPIKCKRDFQLRK